jgi:ABC-type transport system involved in multi-copper enzyme maturation permease subunit
MHLWEKPVSQDWTEERTEAPVSFSMRELLRSIIRFSWGRPIWSWQTLVSLLLVGLAAGAVVAHRAIRGEWAEQEFFSEVLLGGYVGFLLPVLCLSFGTQLVSGAWEEGWLIWLLLRPIPRGLVYGLLLAAAVPWTLALTLGGALLLAALAGHATFRACLFALLPLTIGSVAYLAFFVCLSVWLRRAALVSIAYVFVVENVISYLPGWINRGSISFYIRSLLIADGPVPFENDGILSLVPVSPTVAWTGLLIVTFAFTVAGGMIFSRREYGEGNP